MTTPGASLSITDGTKNRGGVPAGASTTAFYLSSDAILDAGDTLLSPSRSVPALGSNETSTGTISVTIPGGTAPGTYYIIANADNGGVVAESDETNNARISSALTIGANNVDLVISSYYAPTSAKKGTTITLTDVTKNRLTDTTAASTTAAYLSATCTTSPSGSVIGSRAVPSLAGGGSSSGSISALIPSGTTAGSYYIIWKADNGGVVNETDETNNTKCKAITITN
jgi:subtilase family serine protease